MAVRIYKAIQDDGTALWPEERPIAWLESKRRTYPRPIFEAQFQNDPTGLRGVRYDASWLQYWTEYTIPNFNNMVGGQAGDPATSERETSNYFGHCTGAKDISTGVIYILDFSYGHIIATRHEEFLRAQYAKWQGLGLNVNRVLLEETGPQQGTMQHLAAQTRLHPDGPMPLEMFNPKGSKEQRYDSYDSFVICCESEDIARKTHPECGIYEWWKDGQYPSSIDWGWVQSSDIYDQLEVVCIGIADSKLEKGIVISSFNAG